jgi:hypothetical protein
MESASGFVSPLGLEFRTTVRPHRVHPGTCAVRPAVYMTAKGEQDQGIFGRIRNAILRPFVAVPGSGGQGAVVKCPFCEAGTQGCTGCNGTGKDAVGVCLMCEGVGQVTCAVCEGVGMVDRVRRGGTDDRNEYLGKAKRRNPPRESG